MKFLSAIWVIAWSSLSQAWKIMSAYSPEHIEIHGKVINAADRYFVIGIEEPTTYCELADPKMCPNGSWTLVNNDMTSLASAMPGGQNVFVDKLGYISYTLPHSSYRPPGAQIGGFYAYSILTECASPITLLSWQSSEGVPGLWACPVDYDTPLSTRAILKASMKDFQGSGCLNLQGIEMTDGGNDFGAWAYV